jgi:hypothetical protein
MGEHGGQMKFETKHVTERPQYESQITTDEYGSSTVRLHKYKVNFIFIQLPNKELKMK